VLKVDESFAPQIWLVVIPFDCSHAVFIESHHALGNVDIVIFRIILVIGEMMEEWLELNSLVSSTRPRVGDVILRWGEFGHNVYHIIQT
jgi:hypothetical protein